MKGGGKGKGKIRKSRKRRKWRKGKVWEGGREGTSGNRVGWESSAFGGSAQGGR